MKRIIAFVFLLLIFSIHNVFAGWSEPIRISGPGHFENPQIMTKGDTLHVTYTDMNLYYKIGYQRSTDGGLTWSNEVVLSHDSVETTFPRILSSGNRLMVLWKDALVGYYRYNITYSTSTNNGQTWAAPRYVLDHGTTGNLYFAASSGSGLNSNIVYDTDINDTLLFYSIKSTNFGQNWIIPSRIFGTIEGGIPGQVGAGDIVTVVWDGRYNWRRAWEIWYFCSTDGDQTWSPNQLLSTDDGIRSELPSICVNQSGKLFVTWMDGKYSPLWLTGDILGRQSADSGLTWGPERQISSDDYSYHNDAVSSGDTICVAWDDEEFDTAHRSIYYRRSTDDGATWSDPYWIDGTLDDSSDPALAIWDEKVCCIWADKRPNPDTTVNGGVYISRWDPEPDIIGGNQSNLPDKITLSAYPNPFNSSTTISFSNLQDDEIRIFDITGSLVRILRPKEKGNGSIIWDGSNDAGKKVSSGVYIARAKGKDNSAVVKLIYLK